MYKNLLKFIIYSLVALTLFSCTTLQQDIAITSLSDEQNPEILEIEKEVVKIEAESILFPANDYSTKANILIKKLETFQSDINLQSATQAKLFALQGRLYLILKKQTNAEDLYKKAEFTYKGEIFTIILGSRLGIIKNLENEKIAKTDQPFLVLEEGINFYHKNEYLQAVAKFDEAFISLDDFYIINYTPLRNKAWELKNISSQTESNEAAILKKENITIAEMITLTQQTTNLLFKFTASKKYTTDTLVKDIISCGLLNPSNTYTQKTLDEITPNTILTRVIAARFLWNLFLNKNNLSNQTTKYVEQFTTLGFSPIQDLTLDSPDFDAILGCIENEILTLPDGINFYPEEPISGIDFSTSLNHIK